MAIRCCYKCTKRTSTCHSWCPDYADEVEEEKRKKTLLRKASVYAEYKKSTVFQARKDKVKREQEIRGYRNLHHK